MQKRQVKFLALLMLFTFTVILFHRLTYTVEESKDIELDTQSSLEVDTKEIDTSISESISEPVVSEPSVVSKSVREFDREYLSLSESDFDTEYPEFYIEAETKDVSESSDVFVSQETDDDVRISDSGSYEDTIDDSEDDIVLEYHYVQSDGKPSHLSDYNIDIAACVIYNEAGYGTTRRHKSLVGAVLYNRINDPRFPDTLYEVVVQKQQYDPRYVDYNSSKMIDAMNSDIWSECKEIAREALSGQVECPSNVIYQANFKQGTGTYETCYTSYSTSYFCFG